MEIIVLLLIVLGIVAGLIASISIITNISKYYRTRFGFSVWSGVLILFLACILLLFSTYSNSANNRAMLAVISSILCLFTFFRDVRLSGGTYGFLGFLFQAVMTFLMFFVIILILAGILARAIARSARQLTGTYYNTLQEVHYAIILFPVFIRI